MVIHVDVEVVKVGEDCGALDAVQRPQVVLDLVLVLADGGVVVGAGLRLVRGDRALHRHRRRLRQVLQRQFGLVCLLESGNQDGRHLLLLEEGGEGEGEAEVGEGGVEEGLGGVQADGVRGRWLMVLIQFTENKAI